MALKRAFCWGCCWRLPKFLTTLKFGRWWYVGTWRSLSEDTSFSDVWASICSYDGEYVDENPYKRSEDVWRSNNSDVPWKNLLMQLNENFNPAQFKYRAGYVSAVFFFFVIVNEPIAWSVSWSKEDPRPAETVHRLILYISNYTIHDHPPTNGVKVCLWGGILRNIFQPAKTDHQINNVQVIVSNIVNSVK